MAMRYPESRTERNGAAWQEVSTTSPPPGAWAFESLSWNQRKTEKANEKMPRGRAESTVPLLEVQRVLC